MTNAPHQRLAPPIILERARRVLDTESNAVSALGERLDGAFVRACELCLQCRGHVVVSGMGKSGHIGHKIAATLASTGTPAFFVHPGEASHGDLGMITGDDILLALSNSGESRELITLLPLIKRLGIPLIALTGNTSSTLATTADANLDASVAEEACPLNLAPTASTTAALALGDALAITLLESRGFDEQDFARSHPGGTLGRRLLLHVGDLMHVGDAIPSVTAEMPLAQALVEMTHKNLGMTSIVDDTYRILGVYTDGDLRRTLDTAVDVHTTPIREVMTTGSHTIAAEALAGEALKRMQEHQITVLLVTNDNEQLIGVLHMHDLLRAGVV